MSSLEGSVQRQKRGPSPVPLGISQPEAEADEQAKTVQQKQMSKQEGKGGAVGH